MRQVVVLEPAGSVLVIRQTSLGGNVATGNTNSNAGSNNAHETHGLANHAAVSTIASNDHNQNRIVVVRSSSSTCMTTTADNHSATNGNTINANLNGNTVAIGNKTSTKAGGGGTKSNERNDHLRNDHKSQEGIAGESNSGCRPRTSKEAAHENVSLDRKLDGADPISDGDPIKLPENLETLPRAEHFPTQRHRWNTNEVSNQVNNHLKI
ncbi:hypothetical protein WH47_08939 [Habropoda laboriosa]|uniref:Uncharacterized protein n=1 Tax=Habropoda laboriosa TaxID=597456 RepID=A0A0L7R713_9HYME|nr:hypothetical protein WH47_08939 [Habropoda laboriosa]